jgi:serine/threonine protein kinase
MSVTGTTQGRFRLERELGRGAHGQVWLATDTLLDERVALKFLRVDGAEARERLKREVVLARRVQHRGICRVNDLHDIDGQLAISMQLAGGVGLDELMASSLSVTRALRIIDNLADAVAAAHAENVLHRDLKPSNINVDDDDEVVVLDFGIASAGDLARLTAPGVVVGTLRFVAPEVLTTGVSSARSDLYAIGVIAWTLLAGRSPWAQHRSVVELVAEIERGPRDLCREHPQVSSAIAAVINKALAADPDDRFADVAGFRRALGLAMLSSSAAPSSSSRPAPAQHAATQVVRRRAIEPQATTTTITVRPRAPVQRRGIGVGVVVAGGLALLVVGIVTAALLVPAAPPSSSASSSPSPDAVAPSAQPAPSSSPAASTAEPDPLAAQHALEEQLASSSARARTLGLRRGDVPAWDAALAAATDGLRKDPASTSTAEAVQRAAQAIQGVNVDMGLVMTKLQRFNSAVDAAIKRDPAMREKVIPSSTVVARAIASKDAVAANRALNAAFAVLDRR